MKFCKLNLSRVAGFDVRNGKTYELSRGTNHIGKIKQAQFLSSYQIGILGCNLPLAEIIPDAVVYLQLSVWKLTLCFDTLLLILSNQPNHLSIEKEIVFGLKLEYLIPVCLIVSLRNDKTIFAKRSKDISGKACESFLLIRNYVAMDCG